LPLDVLKEGQNVETVLSRTQEALQAEPCQPSTTPDTTFGCFGGPFPMI